MSDHSLLEEPIATSQPAIEVAVSDADVRGAIWLGHKWSKRLLVGGGSSALVIITTAAALWGNALLDSNRGIREDMRAFTASMQKKLEASDERVQGLAIDAAGRDGRLLSVERRINALEAKIEAVSYRRHTEAMERYEERERARQEQKTGRAHQAP